jgi:hypothetical protein
MKRKAPQPLAKAQALWKREDGCPAAATQSVVSRIALLLQHQLAVGVFEALQLR